MKQDVAILLDAIKQLEYNYNQSQIALKIRIHELTEAVKRLEDYNGNTESQSPQRTQGQGPPHKESGETNQVQEQV